MGPGTFEAKFVPLSKLENIETIYILREYIGPEIDKVVYLVLPAFIRKVRLFKIFTPFYLAFYTKRFNCNLIIGYHIIPHTFFAYIASIITNVPFVCAQTGLDIQSHAKKPIFKSLLKMIFKKAAFINVPGSKSVEYWQQFGVNKNKIINLHSTIDTNWWLPSEEIEKKYDFVFLGRLDAVKRIELILKGFKLLLETYSNEQKPILLIVGTGPEEMKLKSLANELNIEQNVDFVGFKSDPRISLQQSKFLIMSSISEGLPTAMMQGMACGALPITNLVGNISDIVTDGTTGFVHNGNLPEDIFKTMSIAMKEGNMKLSQIRNAAREIIVTKHSHEAATTKWRNMLS